MSISTSLCFDFGELNDFYFDLLSEEDFDFKTKDISFEILNKDKLEVNISCESVLELKIATTALIKSLEVIGKTLELEK